MADDIFGKCVWIGATKEAESPVIIRRFIAAAPKKGNLYITGLGYFEARINGKIITEDIFLPVPSDYEPRDLTQFLYPLNDKLTNRIYYYKFDISPYLKEGENVLTIQLGNGFYRQTERVAEGEVSYANILKTVYRMDIESAEGIAVIASDGTERWRESEIRYSNLFYGEVIDPAKVTDEEMPVSVLPKPESILTQAMGIPDRFIRDIVPTLLTEKNGKAIYDAGENISGIVQVNTSAPAGERIVLRFAEVINEDLTLNFESAGSVYIGTSGRPQIMEDVFISNGEKRSYAPKFVWHGFRYFEVEGQIDDLVVKVIHSNVPVTSSFESNLEGANFLYDAYIRTQLNNMHGSYPSDCPHRERLGYTGDGQVCAPAAMLMLDCREFYKKWIQDILDCQDQKTGHIQHTAPFMGGGGGPGGYGCAIILVPYAFYKQYGDLEMLKKCYEPMRSWVSYLLSRCDNGLITREEEGGWCLGDWCTLEPTVLPAEYVNTCYFVKSLSLMEEIARIIGQEQDVAEYCAIKTNAMEAVRSAFFANGSYVDGVQGADAYAVWCGLAGKEIVSGIAQKYDRLGHFDTGFLGTDILLEVLFENGYGDTAIRLLEGEELGSYLYMKRHSATTIWENWSGSGSHNHPMFGACTRHLFSGVLGIRQREGTAGYSDVIVCPCLSDRITYASGRITTENGEIYVQLRQTESGPEVKVYADKKIKIEICSIVGGKTNENG